MQASIPLVLKFEDWPSADQIAWNALFDEAGFLDDAGPCVHWSEGSRRKRQQGYAQWLSFIARQDPCAMELAPDDRIVLDRVERYLKDCRARLKARSISNLIGDLFEVSRNMSPEGEWGWLRLASRRLLAAASENGLPEAPPITASRIFAWSTTRLKALEQDSECPALSKAIWFRQALMIGLLIARPVRRRALLAMQADTHLKRHEEGFQLRFSAEDMKDRKARSMPLPTKLCAYMDAYLQGHRPVLLGDKSSDHLWINQYGAPLTADGLSRELPKVTERHFGVALRPHAFRHIAATSIAEVDPEHVNIIRDILGHATLTTSEKHYNRATGISSCNALQSIVEDIQQDVPNMGRAKRHRRTGNGWQGD